jgi:starch synthase
MKVTFLTNEYPPHVYGGAGVHAEYLSRELASLDGGQHEIQILCFGDQKERVSNRTVEGISLPFDFPSQDIPNQKVFDALLRNIIMSGLVNETDIVHCHTWYTHLAGCLIKQIHNVPLVVTTHSLEPQRPWKKEQLGASHNASTWIEKTAYQNADGVIAVSQSMKMSVYSLYQVPLERIRVIPNGINVDYYRPRLNPSVLASYQIDPHRPFILFVGRISRQKGILHLLNAIKYLAPDIRVVLCAGAPDTQEIAEEMEYKVKEAQSQAPNKIVWLRQWIPRSDLVSIYTHASLFVCPSVYEPFGIINLEAMACGTPVVASAVGGIPEVVVHGVTGLLIPFEPAGGSHWEPRDPDQFSRDLGAAVNELLQSSEKLRIMGLKSREWVEKNFSWKSIARKTLKFYEDLTNAA